MSTDPKGSHPISNQPTLPQVYFTPDAWQKMMAYIMACPIEIQGFGYVDRIGDALWVSEVFILAQYATPASVDADDSAISRHMDAMMRNGEDTSRMRFQWHSHAGGQVYFSQTDLNNIRRLTLEDGWLLSLVGNHYGKFLCRLDGFKGLLSAAVQPMIISHLPAEVSQQVADDIRKLVQRKGFRSNAATVEPKTTGLTVIDAERIDVHDVTHVPLSQLQQTTNGTQQGDL